jgi:hypothetical protein
VSQARRAGLFLGVVIALTLGACGGNGGDSGDGPSAGWDSEQKIVDVITEASTSGDPGDCTRFNTQRALEQATGFKGEAAIKVCERFAGMDPAESVEVSDVSVDGSTASVEVGVTGSELDGQTLELDLVIQGGRWKVDRLTGFVSFDREALDAGVAASFRRLGIPAELRSCVASRFKRLSDDQVQDLYLSFDKGALDLIVLACTEEARSSNVS